MISYQEQAAVLHVVGYEGLYEVTSSGDVYSLNYHREGKRVKLMAVVNSEGYLQAGLCKGGKMKPHRVHRLVAEAFLPNPDGKLEIDHINTIKTDNRVENLRWCSHDENMHNPITRGVQKNAIVDVIAKKVYCLELDRVFESTHEAARQLGLWQQNISKCCIGKRNHTGGYHFRFA